MAYSKKERKVSGKLKVYLEVAVLALLIAFLLRTYVVQAYRIPSGSMEDTLFAGDFVLVYKLAYRLGEEPKSGDVIVFRYPLNPSKTYIKRLIAGPGQTVQIADKQVYLNDKPMADPLTVKYSDKQVFPFALSNRDNFGPLQVPPDQYLVLGDNRDNSQDSREWGFVEKEQLVGKALFVYWSWRPDPDAPKWESPYVIPFFQFLVYYLTGWPGHIRWDRIGSALN
ncbi:MAG: signal peptidase I [candidate division Zixibacteria bacterium RBG_16_50_21]|nr:MAG: signal peptidase I [candidate division Zixibacteria bacterium RBG_16_50_21]